MRRYIILQNILNTAHEKKVSGTERHSIPDMK